MEIIIKCSDDVRGGANIYGESIRELVRCKDCRYCQYKQFHDLYRCIKPNIEHWMYDADIHYCDFGERKGE